MFLSCVLCLHMERTVSLHCVGNGTYCKNKQGALDGGPHCRMSILRNGNIACPCRLFSPMSHVKFKKRLCPMSLQFLAPVTCHKAPCRMSHVEFKKCPCRPVDFRGLGP